MKHIIVLSLEGKKTEVITAHLRQSYLFILLTSALRLSIGKEEHLACKNLAPSMPKGSLET